MTTLRDYQQSALDDVRQAYRNGFKSPLLVAPTGSGKTALTCEVLKGVHQKRRRGVFLVHRAELLQQSSRALDAAGVPHGLIAPRYTPNRAFVQVASVQTLVRRITQYEPFDFVAVDECHHVGGSGNTWSKIIAAYPEAKILGVTATPCRLDGQGLGSVFDTIIEGPSIGELIQRGYLTPPRVYAPPSKADLSRIHQRAGDFNPVEVAAELDRPSITGDAVAHYRQLADGQPAIAFCVTVEHAKHVAETFRQAGYRAASIDGTDTQDHRDRCIRDLASGALHVLTSCNIISEGTDIPVATVAILLRPTMSVTLFLQSIGRVLRPVYEPGMPLHTDEMRRWAIANGPKPAAIILDHVGNCYRHGLPTADREWSLEGRQARPRQNEPVQAIRQCPHCFAVFTPAAVCPECGQPVKFHNTAKLEIRDGLLQEIEELPTPALKGEGLVRSQLAQIARERGYKAGWVYYVMQARKNNHYHGPIDPAGTIREWRGDTVDA